MIGPRKYVFPSFAIERKYCTLNSIFTLLICWLLYLQGVSTVLKIYLGTISWLSRQFSMLIASKYFPMRFLDKKLLILLFIFLILQCVSKTNKNCWKTIINVNNYSFELDCKLQLLFYLYIYLIWLSVGGNFGYHLHFI